MQTQHNHSQHRIGHTLLIAGLFLLLIFGTLINPINSAKSEAFGVSDIVTGTNNARELRNKQAYTPNPLLMNAAQMKAEDMVKEHYFAHTSPTGKVAWDYFKKVGYVYEVAGENLAITNETSDAVIQGWLSSPTHRDNLLSDDYTDFGIGMANYGDYQGHKNTFVIVALYGRIAGNTKQQTLTATTNPAGGTTTFKPKLLPVEPTVLVSVAVLLIVAGVVFEIRHLRRLHHGHIPLH